MIAHEWIGPLVSASVVGLSSWIAVAKTVARMEQRIDDRDEEYARRFVALEQRTGIAGGGLEGSQAVTRRECFLMESSVKNELIMLNEKLARVEREVREIDAKVDQLSKSP